MGNRTSRQDRNGKTTVNAGHSLNYRTSDFVDERGSVSAPTSMSATGGTEYIPGNGYRYHKFTTATPSPESKLIVAGSGVIDLLVVAGGGGGGSYYGGGGGGGGLAYANNLPVSNQTYPVSVGAGSVAVSPTSPTAFVGNDGSNSYFGTPGQPIGGQPNYILAKGGGGGGKGTTTGGRTGGSGGGSGGGDVDPDGNPTGTAPGQATQPGTNPSPFVTDYGNAGGYSTPTGGYAPAGGGGAGAAGVNVAGDIPGASNGGAGQPFPDFAYPLIGEPALNPYSPSNSHYAGGGGAGKYGALVAPDRLGIGGAGGGGGGSGSPDDKPPGSEAGPGIDKLGGGGGGRHPGPAGPQFTGGDGIVIVRYLN